MAGQRKSHTAALQAQVALAALKGQDDPKRDRLPPGLASRG